MSKFSSVEEFFLNRKKKQLVSKDLLNVYAVLYSQQVKYNIHYLKNFNSFLILIGNRLRYIGFFNVKQKQTRSK